MKSPREVRIESKTRRARPVSAFDNDLLLRKSTCQILGSSGIEGLSFAAVSKESGLSHTAVSYRFATIEELLADLWKNLSMPGFIADLDALISDLLSTDKDSKALSIRIRKFFSESDESLAALEILAYSATSVDLRTQVREDMAKLFTSKKKVSSQNIAQYAFLWQTIIGILFHFRLTRVSVPKLADLVLQIADAVSDPGQEIALPVVDASHLKAKRFNTGDEIQDVLLQAAVNCVGRYGYSNSTTNMIAKEAGVTTGSLFARFPTKLDLLVEASSIKYRVGYEDNLKFITKLVYDHGPGIGNAVFLREYLKPGLELERAIELETLRVSWHRRVLHERLAKNINDFLRQIGKSEKTPRTVEEKLSQLVRLAIPTGAILLATVYPPAWEIPFSMITPSVFRAP